MVTQFRYRSVRFGHFVGATPSSAANTLYSNINFYNSTLLLNSLLTGVNSYLMNIGYIPN